MEKAKGPGIVQTVYNILVVVYNAGKEGKPLQEAIDRAFEAANQEGLKWDR